MMLACTRQISPAPRKSIYSPSDFAVARWTHSLPHAFWCIDPAGAVCSTERVDRVACFHSPLPTLYLINTHAASQLLREPLVRQLWSHCIPKLIIRYFPLVLALPISVFVIARSAVVKPSRGASRGFEEFFEQDRSIEESITRKMFITLCIDLHMVFFPDILWYGAFCSLLSLGVRLLCQCKRFSLEGLWKPISSSLFPNI
jgi:hypothetical protein